MSPEPWSVDRAQRALELYEEFTRTSPTAQITKRKDGRSGWENGEWYKLGIDALNNASLVLQNFHMVPEPQRPDPARLADLRGRARSVSALIRGMPSINDSYYVGDRRVNYSQLTDAVETPPSIFRCQVSWGCLWQDTPEDCLAFYREMMSSAAFCYVHRDFWLRQLACPRLVAWNEVDQNRLAGVWSGFLSELDGSTNLLLRMEAKALRMADSGTSAALTASFTDLLDFFVENRCAFITNNTDVLYLNWRIDDLVRAKVSGPSAARGSESLAQRFNSEYLPKLAAKDAECRGLVAATKPLPVPQQPGPGATSIPRPATEPAPAPRLAVAPPASADLSAVATNIVRVTRFLEIPTNSLAEDFVNRVNINAHHWVENRLLLDLECEAFSFSFDDKGKWKGTRNVVLPAIALLDPKTERWDVIKCPADGFDRYRAMYHRSTLFGGKLYNSSGGQIRQFDFASRSWKNLEFSGGQDYQLFAVNGRLYAAGGNMIVEIIEEATGTRVLASARRNPAKTVLDKLPDWGLPVLFGGTNQALRVWIKNKFYSWAQEDWREEGVVATAMRPEIFESGVLFRYSSFGDGSNRIWRLRRGGLGPELCLSKTSAARTPGSGRDPAATGGPEPAWTLPVDAFPFDLPMALQEANLYVMTDHSATREIADAQHTLVKVEILDRNGYHAELMRFSPGLTQPRSVRLKFDSPIGSPPVTGNQRVVLPTPLLPPGWFVFAGEQVCFGLESADDGLGSGQGGRPIGYRPGVWLIPVAQLDQAFGKQQQAQLKTTSQPKPAFRAKDRPL